MSLAGQKVRDGFAFPIHILFMQPFHLPFTWIKIIKHSTDLGQDKSRLPVLTLMRQLSSIFATFNSTTKNSLIAPDARCEFYA
jgi:hypothetical protein